MFKNKNILRGIILAILLLCTAYLVYSIIVNPYSICGGRNGVSSPHLPPLFLFVCILVFCLSVPDNMSRIRSVAKE